MSADVIGHDIKTIPLTPIFSTDNDCASACESDINCNAFKFDSNGCVLKSTYYDYIPSTSSILYNKRTGKGDFYVSTAVRPEKISCDAQTSSLTDPVLTRMKACKDATECYINNVKYNNMVNTYNDLQKKVYEMQLNAWLARQKYYEQLANLTNLVGNYQEENPALFAEPQPTQNDFPLLEQNTNSNIQCCADYTNTADQNIDSANACVQKLTDLIEKEHPTNPPDYNSAKSADHPTKEFPVWLIVVIVIAGVAIILGGVFAWKKYRKKT